MAILLALRGGKRTKFGSSCSIIVDHDGDLLFNNADPGDKGFRILEHGGRWVVDARKCAADVKLGNAQINAAPRSLPARAVLSLGTEKMLFVSRDDDLKAAVDQLKQRIAKVAKPKEEEAAASAPAASSDKPKLPEIKKPTTSGPLTMPANKQAALKAAASSPTVSAPTGPLREITEDEVLLDPAVFAGLVEVIEDLEVELSPMDLAGL